MPRKFSTSFTFDPPLISYLDTLAKEQERTRSQVLSRIIREHAARNGQPIHPDDERTLLEDPSLEPSHQHG